MVVEHIRKLDATLDVAVDFGIAGRTQADPADVKLAAFCGRGLGGGLGELGNVQSARAQVARGVGIKPEHALVGGVVPTVNRLFVGHHIGQFPGNATHGVMLGGLGVGGKRATAQAVAGDFDFHRITHTVRRGFGQSSGAAAGFGGGIGQCGVVTPVFQMGIETGDFSGITRFKFTHIRGVFLTP